MPVEFKRQNFRIVVKMKTKCQYVDKNAVFL